MRLSARLILPARLRPLALAAALAGACAPAAHATVSVALDHSLRLPVSGHAASVVLGNPAVADVTVVDSRTLFVTGKRFGTTDVVVLDPLGRTVFASDIQVTNGAGQHVRIYRAGQLADLSCDPTCTNPAPSTAAASEAPASAPGAAGANAGAMMGALVGGAVGAGAAGAASVNPFAGTPR